jgi:DNA-binding NarL/FixJ family response regulator
MMRSGGTGWREKGKVGTVRIFIVFRDTIYASGLQTTLAASPGIEAVHLATSIALAWESEALGEADVILLDSDLGGAAAFVQEIAVESGARVLLCMHETTTAEVLDAIGNGAAGALARDQLTPDKLLAAVTAVTAGIFALDVGSLRSLTGSVMPLRETAAHRPTGQFTPREQMVLSLVAAGLSNREIAERLSYSERTIKTVIHDVITKLGVKSRSQAVAMAVRERMI